MNFQSPKGTYDILPSNEAEQWKQSALWQHLETIIRETATQYGYREIRTPIYEHAELFARGVGDSSDIVMKEMFTFADRAQRDLSLRPEGTASVMRAFIQHNLAQKKPIHKFFYIGPMFRYERPQSGRYRQFYQFGVEAIGSPSPTQDVETIDLLWEICRRLEITDLKLHINSLGDIASRRAYREALQNYLRPHLTSLSKESQERFDKNPLRILDSKNTHDQNILKEAPSLFHFLSSESKENFEQVQKLLQAIRIPFEINDKVVRGLDYYNNTVYEISANALGAQNALGGGGRFDSLLPSLGGPDLPAVGFAGGMERILQVYLAKKTDRSIQPKTFLYLLPLGHEARNLCFQLATDCRRHHISAEVDLHSKKIQTGLQAAAALPATFCAIIGSDDLANKTAQIKNLDTRMQETIPLEDLLDYCKKHSQKK